MKTKEKSQCRQVLYRCRFTALMHFGRGAWMAAFPLWEPTSEFRPGTLDGPEYHPLVWFSGGEDGLRPIQAGRSPTLGTEGHGGRSGLQGSAAFRACPERSRGGRPAAGWQSGLPRSRAGRPRGSRRDAGCYPAARELHRLPPPRVSRGENASLLLPPGFCPAAMHENFF